MGKYRVYAKILGYVLPNEPLELGECKIEKMTFGEQRRRNFKPLTGWAVKEKEMNYATFPRGADFRIMKSNFVMHTVMECESSNEAIGIAETRFNKIIGVLMLYMHYWWLNRYPTSKIRFSEYDYQICKVYKLVDDKEIKIKDLRPVSANAFMCHYPAFKELTGDFRKMVESYLDCKDETFIKSLIYFTSGIRGFHSQLPEEKTFLDLFKSIELIINSFRKKRKKEFKNKLKHASKCLSLTEEDRKKIIKFYDIRSSGDFAHAKGLRRSIDFSPQYPNPGYCEPFINYFDLIDLSQKIIIHYAKYIKDKYTITIGIPQHSDVDLKKGFNEFYTLGDLGWEINFVFVTQEKNRRKLTLLVKNQVAKRFNVKLKQVKLLERRKDKMILKILR